MISNKSDFYSFFIAIFPLFLILGNALLNLYFFISIFFLLFELINSKNQFKVLFKSIDSILIIFFLLILLLNLYKDNFSLDLILIFRFVIFFFFIKIINNLNLLNINKILFLMSSVYLFVVLDTLFQYFFGKDIFGFEISSDHSGRLTGPFGDEPIPGSFIVSFMFISFFYINKILNKQSLSYVLATLSLFTIFLTGEKISFLMSIFGFFLILLFSLNKKNIIKVFWSLIFLFSLLYLVLTNNFVLLANYIRLFNYFEYDFIISSPYFQHFLTGYMMLLDFPIFGIGHDNFKNLCSSYEYKYFKSILLPLRCAAHIHNLHFQIITSYGIFCYLLFFFFIFTSLFSFYKKINLQYYYPIFIQLLILIIPLKTSGDLFASWYGSLFWFSLAFNFALLKKYK